MHLLRQHVDERSAIFEIWFNDLHQR